MLDIEESCLFKDNIDKTGMTQLDLPNEEDITVNNKSIYVWLLKDGRLVYGYRCSPYTKSPIVGKGRYHHTQRR
jgi:hypothetical protein